MDHVISEFCYKVTLLQTSYRKILGHYSIIPLYRYWKYNNPFLTLFGIHRSWILSVTIHINCIVASCLINVVYLTACAFIRSWWRCTFLWRRQWHCIDTILDNYVIMASLNSDKVCKLINRIPGLRLLISSLPDAALRMHVESLGKPRDVNKRSQSLAYQKTLTEYSLYPRPPVSHFSLLIHTWTLNI